MSRFNSKSKSEDVQTYEGGKAFKKSSVTNWIEFLLGSFMTDSFYESEQFKMNKFNRLTDEMIADYGPEFVRHCAWFARNVAGMRTASQIVAARLNRHSFSGKREFYHSYVRRPDDMSEILALLDKNDEKRSHALTRGFGDAISEMSEYQLGKYKMRGKDWSLVDVVNVCHPKATEAVTKLVNGTLETPTTWETKISAAQTPLDKANRWYDLVMTNQLGMMALVKNLSNILEAADTLGFERGNEMIDRVCDSLVNEVAIKKSLILPMRFFAAYKNLRVQSRKVIDALEKGFILSIGNMPKMDGNTCLILDVSGSMKSPMSNNSSLSICEASAVYAIAYYLANDNVDLIKFGSEAKKVSYNKFESAFTLIEKYTDNESLGFGTNMNAALDIIEDGRKRYDRAIIFSDEQTLDTDRYWWMEDTRSVKDRILKDIKKNGTQYWSYNLGTYDMSVFQPYSPNVHSLTSLAPVGFELMPRIEAGEGELVDYIGSIEN